MTTLKASLALGTVLAISVTANPAFAKGRPAPPPPPAANPNLDEWNLIDLTASDVGAANGGAGVTVALMDGLTDCRHQDLSGRCSNVLMQGGRYRFYSSHGTHTAGIIAGHQFGVATSATIRNYAVFDDRFYVATGNLLINSWRDAYDNSGARISSMSFGCTGTALCFSGDEVRAMADASRPMLYVKAAGNDSVPLPTESIDASTSDASAALARTILVGSVDVTGTISYFSNTAGTGCFVANDSSGGCPSNLLWKNHFIVAPGENIYSTLPGNNYGYMSGTSMATPVVSGAAALLQQKWPALKQDPVTLAEILLTTATDKGAPGVDDVYGWGLLNVAAAFTAQGTVTYQGVDGTIVPLSGATITSGGATLAGLRSALGALTVYDKFGRDFTLGETGAVNFRNDFRTARLMLGRRLLGMGSQRDWAANFFSQEPQARGFSMFGSAGEVPGSPLTFDSALRMGVDMPVKSGLAQFRLTGTTDARTDFSFDPSLRPLGFFASTGMMTDSLMFNALIPLRDNGRLMVYGTTTIGSLNGYKPENPLQLRATADGYMPKLAIYGNQPEQRRSSFGVGFWKKAGEHTVFGINASIMSQSGGYYDLTSSLTDLQQQTHMFNVGAALSHAMGSWEITASGELTHLVMSDNGSNVLHFTPANLVSAELGLRKSGVAFSGTMHDSLAVSFVLPPRAVSGNLRANYMTRTQDGLGRMATSYEVPLWQLGAEAPRIEAAYQLDSGRNWAFKVTGGASLGQAVYKNGLDAMANFSWTF